MEVDTSKRPDQTLNISLKEFGENMKKGGDETDLIQVQVTAKMSKEEVVDKVLKSVMDSDENHMVRLNDGFYKLVDHIFEHMEVTGEKIELRDSFDNFDSRA